MLTVFCRSLCACADRLRKRGPPTRPWKAQERDENRTQSLGEQVEVELQSAAAAAAAHLRRRRRRCRETRTARIARVDPTKELGSQQQFFASTAAPVYYYLLSIFCYTPLLLDTAPAVEVLAVPSLILKIELEMARAHQGQDDLNAALEHPDRVRRVDILSLCPDVFEVVEAMRVPFPALTHLRLAGPESDDEYDQEVLDIPDEFLDGSAPCLQHLHFENVSFPRLPTLLLSARDLVSLQLESVPPNCYDRGYISPEEIVSSLAVLTKLRTLNIMRYPPEDSEPSPIPSDEQRRRPDPPMLAVLPALTEFVFGRDFGYLEDLVAQIDAPLVEVVRIEYLTEGVQTRQLSQFIGRSNLKLSQFRRAQVAFHTDQVYIDLDLPQGECLQAKFSIILTLNYATTASPVFYVVFVLGQLVAMTSSVSHLRVCFRNPSIPRRVWKDPLESEWLPLLRLFSAVKVLEVSGGLEGCIASALEDTAEETPTTLLPALQLLWPEDDNCNKPERFLSSRQHSGRPVTIANTQEEFVERLNAHRRRQEKVP
ncbi:hypothetical protein EDB84DRAFT_1435927 [Lactarius hengduanensis]|nr:hypothetical protein EDB84DRAFT_1435927 [Lactarius hengduanensis]